MHTKEKQYTQHEVPEGYWRDAKGHLVHIDMVKEIDRLRDEMVGNIVDRAIPINAALTLFKPYAFGESDAFRALSAERYQAPIGGTKGNLTYYSFDGEHRIEISVQDRIAFDERLQAAKALIDECIMAWSAGARPEILAIINDAFYVDKKGKIRIQDILDLRRLDITDEKWLRAMDAINESIQVIDSCRYIRIYRRVGESNEYKQISLNITGV